MTECIGRDPVESCGINLRSANLQFTDSLDEQGLVPDFIDSRFGSGFVGYETSEPLLESFLLCSLRGFRLEMPAEAEDKYVGAEVSLESPGGGSWPGI
jgi:hypothetical protein